MPADRRRARSGGVRARVTAAATLVVVAVLIATGFALVTAQRRLLIGDLDDRIAERAGVVAGDVAGGRAPAALARSDDDLLAQVVGADGRVLAASPGTAAVPLAPPLPAGRSELLRTVHGLPGDPRSFRLLSLRVPGDGDAVTLHMAGALEDVEESTAALVTTLSVAVPAAVAVLAALTWALVGRTLRPVEAIRAEVAGIGGGELDRRVPEPPGDDEIARLARTMNAMLERVQEAGRRQQAFVADASHELRGPLTRLRTELEVELAHPSGGDPAAATRSVLQEVAGLQRLVEDLLVLARGDAGVAVPRPAPVDLDDIVLEQALRVRAAGAVTVDVSGVSAAQVAGDRGQLARAVANLVDNAARHATRTVVLELAERDGAAVLSVTDDGPGIPAEARERVFERFTRLEQARTASPAGPAGPAGDGGTGLGLAIAREIAVRHAGTITIDPGHRPGARFLLVLPAASSDIVNNG